jgi:hypothetical protein
MKFGAMRATVPGVVYTMSGQPDRAQTHASIAHELNDDDPWTRVSSTNCPALSGAHEQARTLSGQLFRNDLLISPR